MPSSVPPSSTQPFSVRLSAEERARLEHEAAGMSLGAYIRWRVLNSDAPPPRSRGKFPVKDHQLLAQALGLLGQSRIASNLNQLARAANTGGLVVDESIASSLAETARMIADVRSLLLTALGLDDSGP